MEMGKIRSILEGCARKRRTITYGELGELIGRPDPQGSWPELDAICDEDFKARPRRPDLSLLVVYKDIGLPGKFRGKSREREDWTNELVAEYRKDRAAVYDHYSP